MKVRLCTLWTVLLAQVFICAVGASRAGERGNVLPLYRNIAMYGNEFDEVIANQVPEVTRLKHLALKRCSRMRISTED